MFHRDPGVFAFVISQREQREGERKKPKRRLEGRKGSEEARKLKNQCYFVILQAASKFHVCPGETRPRSVPRHDNKSGINLLKAFSQIQTSPLGNFVTRRIEYAISFERRGGCSFLWRNILQVKNESANYSQLRLNNCNYIDYTNYNCYKKSDSIISRITARNFKSGKSIVPSLIFKSKCSQSPTLIATTFLLLEKPDAKKHRR